jgi:hypothetical protein
MFTLTVGYVSGIIAAIIFILQSLLPNASILILVGVLGKDQNAATWSGVERELASSAWPRLLRTDSTVSVGMKPKLRFARWLRPICFFLITAAGIVTPLGLYDTVAPSGRTQLRSFSYIADTGPMGYGTPPRADLTFGRSCGDFLPLPCPGTSVDIQYSYNETSGIGAANITNDNYDMRIPEVLAKLYQSGLYDQEQTVSSFFDIQSRQYTYDREVGVEHGGSYVVDAYRQVTSLILDDDIEVVEGLIVDTKNGGIGFRNHTVPVGIHYGAEWQEDLLFLEPETACVNTNMTREYMIPWPSASSDGYQPANVTLVDQGGFVEINKTYPRLEFYDTQENPALLERAYKAAWLTNTNNMLYFNVTRPNPHACSYLNSKVGQRYPLNLEGTSPFQSFSVSPDFSSLVDPQLYQSNDTFLTEQSVNYRNPFNITFENYTDIKVLCEGVGGQDLANINNIAVACGLVLGAAKRKDGIASLVFAPGTWWSQPVYTCASTTKASIKTVHFKYNATIGEGLKSLQVVYVADKVYKNDSEKPLWGVENPHMVLSDISPLWGLISPDLEDSVNLSTIKSDRLYLPGYTILEFDTQVPGFQNVPGTDGPTGALATAYDSSGFGEGTGVGDYTGETNLAMFSKWQDYSSNVSTTAKILNLIWTDIAANALVGTKSWNSGSKLPPNLQKRGAKTTSSASTDARNSPVMVPVTIYTYQVRYHWVFVIPAALLLLLALLILGVAGAFALTGHATFSCVREYLFHLSAGRLLARQVYPGAVDGQAATKIWVDNVGLKHVRLDSDGPIATDAIDAKITTGSSGDSEVDNAVVQDVTASREKFTKAATEISTKEVDRSPSNDAGSQPLDGISRGHIALQNRDDDRAQHRMRSRRRSM